MKVLAAAFMMALLFLACASTVYFGKVQAATMWIQTYGGTEWDYGFSVVETSDGGYAIAGYTKSYGAGSKDFWLVKTDASGNEQWNQTYGGTRDDEACSMVQTGDGGYAIAGVTISFGDEDGDFWLVKTDASGNEQWNQTYGGTDTDYGYSVIETGDGGYAIAGYTGPFDGDRNFWLVKTDASGTMQWNQTYGGTDTDLGFSVVETGDGGYAIAGYTMSYGAGASSVWLVKTDAAGNEQWNQTYGGNGVDQGRSVVETSDGGYAIVGFTGSFGAGTFDVWLVKADASGTMQWSQTYGGIDTDYGYSAVETGDGGYIIAGSTCSYGNALGDFWLVKTDASGNEQWNQTYGGEFTEEGLSVVGTSDGGYAIVGYTLTLGPGDRAAMFVKTDEFGVVPETAWVVLPLLIVATVSIFISKKKLLHKQ